MPRLKVTDDELDLLTEEERIGLKEYQAELEAEAAAEDEEIRAAAAGDPEEDTPPPPPLSDQPPGGEDEDDEPAEDEPVEDDEPAEDDEPPAEEEPAEEEPAEDEPDVLPTAAEGRVMPVASLTQAEEARITAIKREIKEIAQKFDDGEITASEMRDQQEPLEDERELLWEKRAVAKATTEAAVNNWYYGVIPAFMRQHPQYKEGTLRYDMLNNLVKDLQKASVNPTDPQILYTAHDRIAKEFGEVEAKPAKKKKANGNGQREVPPKFADIPASDQTVVTLPNKFARLEKLKGADYERALSRLSVADREIYLQGG